MGANRALLESAQNLRNFVKILAKTIENYRSKYEALQEAPHSRSFSARTTEVMAVKIAQLFILYISYVIFCAEGMEIHISYSLHSPNNPSIHQHVCRSSIFCGPHALPNDVSWRVHARVSPIRREPRWHPNELASYVSLCDDKAGSSFCGRKT